MVWMTALLSIAFAEPIPVEVVAAADGGFTLIRDGAPFVVQGVGGEDQLTLLTRIGGNAIRTWGVGAETGAFLDAAHAQGLAVSVGIWLGHDRHGFDYTDAAQVAAQKAAAREAVLAYRDHPAVLVWGVGNEMEGFAEGDDPDVWSAVCDIADMVQELDPNHPVMTTTAEIGGGRVAAVDACDGIDIHGVNAYGGAASVPSRYREAGGTKPLLLTEYGPTGSWETDKTEFGLPYEATSTDKAAVYATVAGKVVSDPLMLGGFAFLWGEKVEATPTWFGMFLPDGTRLGSVDALADVWGQPVENRAPVVKAGLQLSADGVLKPGSTLTARWDVSDPEGDPIETEWVLFSEVGETIGGDTRPRPPAVGGITSSSTTEATLTLPRIPGQYRLMAVARDGQGGGATATAPIQVGAPPAPGAAPPVPMWVYQGDGLRGPWVPSGWMGAVDAIARQDDWTEGCASPPTCIKVTVRSPDWAGVAWQHPANNWGEQPGGFDLSNARFLVFRVRADQPIPGMKFGAGLIEGEPHSDSLKREKTVDLSETWQTIRIKLRGDRSQLITGFWWVAPMTARKETTFYIDDIRFE